MAWGCPFPNLRPGVDAGDGVPAPTSLLRFALTWEPDHPTVDQRLNDYFYNTPADPGDPEDWEGEATRGLFHEESIYHHECYSGLTGAGKGAWFYYNAGHDSRFWGNAGVWFDDLGNWDGSRWVASSVMTEGEVWQGGDGEWTFDTYLKQDGSYNNGQRHGVALKGVPSSISVVSYPYDFYVYLLMGTGVVCHLYEEDGTLHSVVEDASLRNAAMAARGYSSINFNEGITSPSAKVYPHHIAVQRRGDTVEIFRDGILTKSYALPAGAVLRNTTGSLQRFSIGCDPSATGGWGLGGVMDNTRFFSAAIYDPDGFDPHEAMGADFSVPAEQYYGSGSGGRKSWLCILFGIGCP